jgi:hypothetical protein
MKFIMNQGVFYVNTLVSPTVMSELFKPYVLFNISHSRANRYGYGWFISSQAGYKIIGHSGGVEGFVANVMIVPELKIGIVVLCNQDSSIPFAISRFVIGQYIGVKDYDISTKILEWQKIDNDRIHKRFVELGRNQVKNTHPSLDLESFTGTYYDKMYGELYISLEDKKLILKFEHSPTFTAELGHYHFNTFRLQWQDPTLPEGLVLFNLNSKNEIAGFEFDIPRLLDADIKELSIKRKK